MAGTASAPSADRPSALSPDARRSARDANAASELECLYCRAGLVTGARKCRGCGEWVVRTAAGPAAGLLRLFAWCWAAVALVAGAGVWYAATAARGWVVARAVDTPVPLLVLDVAVYAIAGVVVLQGLTAAVFLGALANLMPRRPRWWT